MTVRFRNGVAAGAIFFALGGCKAATVSDSVDDVSSTNDALTTAGESLDAAKTAAAACFDAFDTCAAADGADVEACRTTLSSCLPETPPPPKHCGRESGPGDGGARPPRHDGPPSPPPNGSSAAPEEGDRPPPPDGSGKPPHGDCDGGHEPHGECAPPPLGAGKLGACRDDAHLLLANGSDTIATKSAHSACMEKAFREHEEPLCKQGRTLCEGKSSTSCDTLTSLCDTIDP